MEVKHLLITIFLALVVAGVIVLFYWFYTGTIFTYDDCAKKGFVLKKVSHGVWRCAVLGTDKEFFFYEE